VEGVGGGGGDKRGGGKRVGGEEMGGRGARVRRAVGRCGKKGKEGGGRSSANG